ncbi:MAG TPA: YggT family protein, partial [Candidatus Limnocylindrales bacterium]|nr:YggT family protein [Candidatus Limnocylindrales bacterium]
DHDHAPVAIERDRAVHRSVVVDDRPTSGEMVRRVVLLAFGILQALLIVRIVLLLLVANPGNEVVAFVLGVTDPFVEPFRGMFQLDRIGSDAGSVLDVAGGVALLGWTLIEMLVLAALSIGARRGEDATV